MNLTIPIRAQNSTTSWSRDSRGNFPGKHTWRYARGEHKRYIFSLITVGLLVSTLVVGSVGSMVQMASARDNYGWRGQSNRQNNNDRGGSSNSSRNSNTNTPAPTTTTKTATPAKTTTVAPTTTPPPATPAPAVATPAPKQVVTPQIVAQPAAAPEPVDTAPEVVSTAAAQATTDNKPQPVTYTSQRLSDETRNRIIIMAVVAATTGALLYTMSMFGAAATEPKRAIPVRYTIPVREVTSY